MNLGFFFNNNFPSQGGMPNKPHEIMTGYENFPLKWL